MSLVVLPAWFRREAMRMEILPLTADHAERLAELHALAFASPWNALDFEGMLTDRAMVGDGLFLAGSPEPSGFVLSRRVVDEAELLTVTIAPEARGRGYGRPLLLRHLDHLAGCSVRVVHLEVEESNAPALALYRTCRFVEVGRRAAYYPKADGSRAAALTMSARI